MLLAAWIGLLWGLAGRRQRISDVGPPIENGDDA
jgi:hypothetical protein